jgi:hypothetical protein
MMQAPGTWWVVIAGKLLSTGIVTSPASLTCFDGVRKRHLGCNGPLDLQYLQFPLYI